MKSILVKILCLSLVLGMVLSLSSIASASELLSYDNAINRLGNISLTDTDELKLIYNSFQVIGSRYFAPQYKYLTAALLELSGDENVDFDRIEVALTILKSNDVFVSEYMAKDSLAYLPLEALLAYVNARKLEAAGNFEEAYEAYASCQILDSIDRAIAAQLWLQQYSEPIAFPNIGVENKIRDAIGKQSGDIYPADVTSLEQLWLYNVEYNDISFLKQFTGIKVLGIETNSADISPLKDLTNLTDLYLHNTQLSDISPLKNLKNLELLWISNSRIKDISPLEGLTNLENLDLSYNQIRDIAPLKGLNNLLEIDLTDNQISDISPLKELMHLAVLELSSNNIIDITPLAGLTNLTELTLARNKIEDVSTLKVLTNLTKLDIQSNKIDDISSLVALTKLRYFDFSGNRIDNISPLRDMELLESIYMTNNNINDISPLMDLMNLQNIWISNNPISATQIRELFLAHPLSAIHFSDTDELSIAPLSDDEPFLFLNQYSESAIRSATGIPTGDVYLGDAANAKSLVLYVVDDDDTSFLKYFTNLERLQLVWLNDISALQNMKNLEELLVCASLCDISPLENLTDLKKLYLGGNDIVELSPLRNLKKLKVLILRDNHITDVSTLYELTNLDILSLSGNPLSAKQIEQLQLKLPNTVIYFTSDPSFEIADPIVVVTMGGNVLSWVGVTGCMHGFELVVEWVDQSGKVETSYHFDYTNQSYGYPQMLFHSSPGTYYMRAVADDGVTIKTATSGWFTVE